MYWHWYDVEMVRVPGEGRTCTFRIHVKFWHPAFWMECFRTLRASGCSTIEAVHLTMIAVWTLAKRKR